MMTKIQDVNKVSTTLFWSCGSAVKCGCFRSTCMSQHRQRSEWQNTRCHRKSEPYLTVILRHFVRRDPNNQIRLQSPIYSPAMLIKWLRYRHESCCAKRSPFVYISWSDSYMLRWRTIQKVDPKLQCTLKAKSCSEVALIINMHVLINWMPDCNINRVFIRIFCPIHGWCRRPRMTGTTCVRTVHDQLYVSLGMASPPQLPLLIGWRNLTPMPMVIVK